MHEKIVPRLNYVIFFEENGFKEAKQPVLEQNKWYIQGHFFVKDELTEIYNITKPFYKRRRGNKDGDLGHAFPFFMCNSEYQKKYKKILKIDGYKPIVLEKFTVEKATDLLAKKIRDAGDYITIGELWKHLSSFADTEYDL